MTYTWTIDDGKTAEVFRIGTKHKTRYPPSDRHHLVSLTYIEISMTNEIEEIQYSL